LQAGSHRVFRTFRICSFSITELLANRCGTSTSSRNINETYNAAARRVSAGGNVSKLLNDVLTTRIPDPAQRQAAVNQLIASQGLPQVLDAPVNLYTQQSLLLARRRRIGGLFGR
jgi:hypothetical protein